MKAFVLPFLFCLLTTSALVAQTINATQSDQIINDNKVTNRADPGDRIRYTIVVSETGNTTDATGVQVTVNPGTLATLAGGSFKTSPLAMPDAYPVTGNVPITVPDGATDLLANDFDDTPSGLTITAGTFSTTQSGSITISTDGSFTYTPPAGFTGTDTYTYTLNDGNDVDGGGPIPGTDLGVITFTVSNLIWFIDNTGGGSGGDGRRNTPFKTLADFNAGSAAVGNVIYIEHTGTDYAGGIALLNNERLFGEGHTGGANLVNVLPFVLAANSVPLPNINGSRPVITNAGGYGITLAPNNTIRGLNLGNCSNFAIIGGGSVGLLTISEVDINNTTGGAFRTDAGGTLAVMLGSLTSGGGANGIHLSSTGGSFTVSGATSISNSTGIGLLIDGTSSGASANFASITVSNTGSHGIQIINNTGSFTATGTTIINSPQAGGNISLNISGGSGAISFAAIDINGRRDKGMRISAGNRNITTGTVDIDNTNTVAAIGLEILSLTGGTINFGATTINNNNAAGSAVEIQSSAAAVTFASGSAISNSASHEFFVNGGNGNVTYNGSITSTAGVCLAVNGRTGGTTSFTGAISSTGAGIGIAVGSNTGGTVEFTGSSKSISSSTAAAVNLTTNTNATINFSGGGLAITTTSGTGFNATGGGTVTVQGSNNTINSNSATALNVASTTIGASGLTFRSISSGAGTASGIILDNTGTNAGLTVTGNGSAGTGGTIANKTGADGSVTTGIGIYLNNTKNASFSWMQMNDFSNFAIRGELVNNFTLKNSFITGVSGNTEMGAGAEGAIRFGTQNGVNDGLTGVALFEGDSITGGYTDNVSIILNSSNGVLNVTFQDGVKPAVIGLNSTTAGNDGILIESSGSSSITSVIDGVRFVGARGDNFQSNVQYNSTQDVTFKNNICHNSHSNVVSGGGGIWFSAAGQYVSNYNLTYDISNNSFRGAEGDVIRLIMMGSTGNISGKILNNIIGVQDGSYGDAQAITGSRNGGDGIAVLNDHAAFAGTLQHATRIEGNQIRDIKNGVGGINIRANGNGTVGSTAITIVEATVKNNIVEEGGADLLAGMYCLIAGSSNAVNDYGKLGLDISGNTLKSGPVTGDNAILLDLINSTNARYYFPGYAGSQNGENASPPGTASANLTTFLTTAPKSNVLTNGGFPSFPAGKVQALTVKGVLGTAFTLPVP